MKSKKLRAMIGIVLALSMAVPGQFRVKESLAKEAEKNNVKSVSALIDHLKSDAVYSSEKTGSSTFNYMTEEAKEAALKSAESLPEKYDLRDKGIVTPVKYQNPFNTCWVFGSIGAAETSLLTALGTNYEESKLDLSEQQLAQFIMKHLPKNMDSPQAGEGYYTPGTEKDTSLQNALGAWQYNVAAAFASGIGPVSESETEYKYKGKNGITSDRNGTSLYYSYNDDWTIPEKYRFRHDYDLVESNTFPWPANIITDKYGNDKYEYNEAAVKAIKSELYKDRGVAISFYADTSTPDSPNIGAQYINVYGDNPTWAHYTNDILLPNHTVEIVGWDDNYPKENFLVEPEGNGAWIVKNSWGAEDQEFPNKSGKLWGVVNEEGKHSGYFYMSYYDKSCNGYGCPPQSYVFEKKTDNFDIINQHDFMVMLGKPQWELYDARTSVANIFTAEEDQYIESVGSYTVHPQTKVNVKLYEMLDGAKEPDEGFLIVEKNQKFEYGGFHRIDLDKPFLISKGKKFSAVVTSTVDTEEGTKYLYTANFDYNESDPQIRSGEECYQKGIVNPGESYVYYEHSGKWFDYADVVDGYKEDYPDIDFDNFNIKVYSQSVDSYSKGSALGTSVSKQGAGADEKSKAGKKVTVRPAKKDKFDYSSLEEGTYKEGEVLVKFREGTLENDRQSALDGSYEKGVTVKSENSTSSSERTMTKTEAKKELKALRKQSNISRSFGSMEEASGGETDVVATAAQQKKDIVVVSR